MTPHEWDTTADVDALLRFVRGRVSDRKMMLFAGGCCRLVEGRVPLAAAAARRFETQADQPLKADEKFSLLSVVWQFVYGNPDPMLERLLRNVNQSPWQVAAQVAGLVRQFQGLHTGRGSEPGPVETTPPPASAEAPAQAAVLREIVGRPFDAEPFDPRWRTETVVQLARTIEDELAWDRMPILADALQDAGCEDDDILAHCRGPHAGHRRGCWVVDAILDRP